jgi:two-component system cell cycle response regulator DivK
LAEQRGTSVTTETKTVLVVEDFDDIRDAMKILVELQGYRVLTATDGREAIEKAREFHPDLILMDLAMPLIDGIEATKQIRSDPSVAAIPIIAVTSFSSYYHDEALAAGCNSVIEKPSIMNDIGLLRSVLP